MLKAFGYQTKLVFNQTTLPQLVLCLITREMMPVFKSLFMVPTRVGTEHWVDQMSPLVHAGHSSVSYTLAALLSFPLALPALQGSCSRGIRENAGRPVSIGLGQNLITGTSLRLFQLCVQAMLLLFTATWAEYRPKDRIISRCGDFFHLHLFSNKYSWVVVWLMITFSLIYQWKDPGI